MTKIGKRHSKKTKFEAVILMISGNHTIAELCEKYKVHQSALFRWKKDFLEMGPDIFDSRPSKIPASERVDYLQRKIGELTMDVDFLKKALER